MTSTRTLADQRNARRLRPLGLPPSDGPFPSDDPFPVAGLFPSAGVSDIVSSTAGTSPRTLLRVKSPPLHDAP
ncbi:hypothetical protein [Streptomyces sp. NBC_01515]|uniref:hypothetical protein n=1 Tax=Streptomyces sp. NBC_01515 TaxID=2903890 RepID=UPI003866010C